MKLNDIAAFIEGELKGDPHLEIKGAAGLEEATEGEISYLAGLKGIGKALQSAASCIIVQDFVDELKCAQIRVKQPQYAFALLLERFHAIPLPPVGIDERAYVDEKAEIANNASVGAFAYISRDSQIGANSIIYPGVYIGAETVIGENCIVYPNVVIRDGVTMGDRCIVHSCAVIGSDGFGYVQHENKHHKIPQVGGVQIGDNVEIGACTTIDRATTGVTVIGSGTKIDNLVQVAHNVRIGENSIVVSQVGIAGSTSIGKHVVIGGQTGIADHVDIADGTYLAARTGVISDLKKGIYVGAPATPRKEYLRVISYFLKLPELNDKLKELEKRLQDLERRDADD